VREKQRRPRKRRWNLPEFQVAASGHSEIRAYSPRKRLGWWWGDSNQTKGMWGLVGESLRERGEKKADLMDEQSR
jgi:hypothetical protein